MKSAPINVSGQIRVKIKDYAANPASQTNNVIKMKGRDALRMRVGNWRVIFDDDGSTIAVMEIGPRSGIYKN